MAIKRVFCSVHLYELLLGLQRCDLVLGELLLCALVRVASKPSRPQILNILLLLCALVRVASASSARLWISDILLLCALVRVASLRLLLMRRSVLFFCSVHLYEFLPVDLDGDHPGLNLLLCALVRVASFRSPNAWEIPEASALCTCTSCFVTAFGDYDSCTFFCSVHLYELLLDLFHAVAGGVMLLLCALVRVASMLPYLYLRH